ncbi:MAG: hypothetical protein IJI41_13605 [Anaerolineaceae bacterium]|nr:hypothetical protein [Anaerolineaceae bacterium]
MFPLLENYLKEFRSCFTREATFKWFVIIVIGFMQRSDRLGITSVIRVLCLDGNVYECMRNFFYSAGWTIEDIRSKWYALVNASGLVYRIHGRTVLAGDGVKQSKEARYMPGVKKMVQESEDSSKAQFIFGHLFGTVGVVLGKQVGSLCLPLKMNIQDGLHSAASWEESTISAESHVIQMIESGFETAKSFGKSVILLDRYFLTVPALQRLSLLNASFASEDTLLEIVSKAKSNCVAYRKPESLSRPCRGRPRKKGEAIHLRDLWKDLSKFQSAVLPVYGKDSEVRFYSCDMLWGKKIYRELRFVLAEYNGMRSILVSTDLTLSPEEIISLYALRFKIENCFREFKQQFGGFAYHFWTKKLPKLNHFKKNADPDPLDAVSDARDRKLILSKVKAIEGFVLLSTIAMGLTQIISLSQGIEGELQNYRYLRTQPRLRISEASVMDSLRKSFFAFMLQHPDSFITRYIREKQLSDSHEFEAA